MKKITKKEMKVKLIQSVNSIISGSQNQIACELEFLHLILPEFKKRGFPIKIHYYREDDKPLYFVMMDKTEKLQNQIDKISEIVK